MATAEEGEKKFLVYCGLSTAAPQLAVVGKI